MASQKVQLSSTMQSSSDEILASLLTTSEWGPALAVLWDRHAGLLYSTARSLCRSDDDARDTLSEALARIAQRAADKTLEIESSFKSYAVMTVRNASHNAWRRVGRVDVTEDIEGATDVNTSFLPDPVMQDVDEAFVAIAFARLPERYRQVLWLVEVEGFAPREVADLLSMTSNNVSQIAGRARAALREGWAAEHLSRLDVASGCRDFVRLLPGLAAGTLAAPRIDSVQSHLAACSECSQLNRDLMDDTVKLRSLVLAVPLAVLFRQLRRVASGAAQSAGTSAGVFARAVETARRLAGVARVVLTSGRQAAFIGLGAVATITTVTVGTYALTTRGSESSRIESPPVVVSGSDGLGGQAENDASGSEVDSAPGVDPVPVNTTLAPQTTQPPVTTQVTTTTQLPTAIPGLSFPPVAPVKPRPPTPPPPTPQELISDVVFTTSSSIRIGETRTWTFRGTAGETIFFTSSLRGSVEVQTPDGADMGPCTSRCRLVLPTNGMYSFVFTNFSNGIPAGAVLLVSSNLETLEANIQIAIEDDLPYPTAKVWAVAGSKGQVVAVGLSNRAATATIISADGSRTVCTWARPCMLPASGEHTLIVTGNPLSGAPVVPAGTALEYVTAAGDPLVYNIPVPLGRGLLRGMYRAFSFDGSPGETVLANSEWKVEGDYGYPIRGLIFGPSGTYLGGSERPVTLTEAGRHTVFFWFDNNLPLSVQPGDRLVEITTSSGVLNIGVPEIVGKDRPRGLRSFWTLDVDATQTLNLTATLVDTGGGPYLPLVQLVHPLGKKWNGYGSAPIPVSPATYYVTVTESIASTEVMVGNTVLAANIDVPVEFDGPASQLAGQVWQFRATAGQRLIGAGGFYSSAAVGNYSSQLQEIPYAFNEDCSCHAVTIPANGTYYFRPGVPLGSAASLNNIISTTVGIFTVVDGLQAEVSSDPEDGADSAPVDDDGGTRPEDPDTPVDPDAPIDPDVPVDPVVPGDPSVPEVPGGQTESPP